MDAGKCLTSMPSISYATHTGISSRSLRTSILVITSDVNPHILLACSTTTRSSHPQRLPRPVVTPNSPPRACSFFSASASSSVTNGPSPTRVVYALTTPSILSILLGATPEPVQTPPPQVAEDVTYG